MNRHFVKLLKLRLRATAFFLVFFSNAIVAELRPLDNSELELVTGQLGLIVNDFKFFGHADANIQLTFDTSLADDSGYMDHISIYGSDSSAGCHTNPTIAGCSGLSIGTASDPMRLNIKTASGYSYLEFLFPQNRSSESGIDADFRVLTNTYNSTGKIDISWVSIRDLKLAGTSMKLWSHDVLTGYNGDNPLGASIENILNANFNLNVDFANSRATSNEYEKLAPHSTNDTPKGDDKGILKLVNVDISNMRLGFFPTLPVTAGTINRDQGQPDHDVSICSSAICAPDLYLEMPSLPNNAATYNAYYATSRATVKVDQVFIGASGGSAYNVGSAEIRDIRIQHLRLETRG